MSDNYYTVQTGDSPVSIAQKMYGNGRMFAEIMKANGAGPLRPGMKLFIPPKVEHPFVSNELAAAFGMATSGQLADLGSNNGDQFSATQALQNIAWSSAHARGQADDLVWGRLPDTFTGGAGPSATPHSPTPPATQANLNRWQNQSTGTFHTPNMSNVPQTPPSQIQAPAPNGAITGRTKATLEERMPVAPPVNYSAIPKAQGINPPPPQSYGNMWTQTLNGLEAIPQALAGIFKALGATGGPAGYSGSDVDAYIRASGQGQAWSSGQLPPTAAPTTTPVASGGSPTTVNQPAATVTEPIAADYATSLNGIDWMAVRAGLNVYPTWDYDYPYWGQFGPCPGCPPDGGGGGGGGYNYSSNSNYVGLINLRLSTGT